MRSGVYLAVGAARFKVGKPRRGDTNERRVSERWKIYEIEKQLTIVRADWIIKAGKGVVDEVAGPVCIWP
jgi:hypothetical protein